MIGFRTENIKTDATFENIRSHVFETYGSEGWEPFNELNFGFLASFDSRDNQFYPQKGIFAKSTVSTSKAAWGSTYSVTDITFDLRQYIPVFNNQLLAWQACFSGAFSKDEIPFQLLPTIGGRDMLRGRVCIATMCSCHSKPNTGYRIPVYKRLKAAVFCAAGDVMNSDNYQIKKLKVAYGAGLRYRLNDARVHLRFDVAKNNYGEKLQFYITATEAF
jgi:outer membrane protein assembly factor BamA